MKRKLIVTLVASALELYAASATAQAQGQCDIVGSGISSTSGATAVHAGPLDPINGFPEYVTDSTGLSLQRCLDAAVCAFDPIVPNDPFSLQIGSGGEAFYWAADNLLNDGSGNLVLKTTMAAETAFLGDNPATGGPLDGTQFPFLRLRFVLHAPADGTYTVKHPYGTEIFTVVGATGARDIFSTVDRGLSANSDQIGSVGPFLVTNGPTPAGYVGDAATPVTVLGSPCGRNSVEITGVSTNGSAITFGATGETRLISRLFTVWGKVFDGKTQTPLNATRLTYSRSATGNGQIDAFATTTATTEVRIVDGPTIPATSSRIPAPVLLDTTAITDVGIGAVIGIDSTSVALADAASLPPIITMTANETALDTAGAPLTDTTSLNLHLVDFVDIAAAVYDSTTGILSVTASSADLQTPPTLTLREFGDFAAGQSTKLIITTAPPAVVHVDSSHGGTATAQVRLLGASALSAPTSLVATPASSTSVTLSWANASTGATGLNVYRVSADGLTRTLVTSLAANVTSTVVGGLAPATAYGFQVDAVNPVGAASSALVTASTLALPVAPASVSSALGTQRSIVVSWTDNANDETGFQVLRATNVAGPYTQVATAPAAAGTGVRSIIDTDGPPATGTTYFYRVVTQRGADSSAATTDTTGVATPTTPTSAVLGTPAAVSATQINVSWTDRATNETGYQVFRRTGTTGTFTAITGVLPAITAAAPNNVGTFNDTSVVAGTQYFYRVDVSNWAGSVPSAVSAGITPPVAVVTLAAPTNLVAVSPTANPPVLSWGDASTGETAYRVQRRTVTLSNNGARTNGAYATVGTLAANATAFTDSVRTANAMVEYSVAAMNGTTAGTARTVLAVPGGIPGVAAAPTFTRTGNTVTVRWAQAGTATANRAAIGGYSVQRCTVTVADNCAAGSAGWAGVATVNGRTTVTAT
ncbi:MAG: hypothetical protein RL375_2611, partial [Pseudomonadota bacterium]